MAVYRSMLYASLQSKIRFQI